MQVPWHPKEGIASPEDSGAGISGGCEALGVGAGNQIWGFCRISVPS